MSRETDDSRDRGGVTVRPLVSDGSVRIFTKAMQFKSNDGREAPERCWRKLEELKHGMEELE